MKSRHGLRPSRQCWGFFFVLLFACTQGWAQSPGPKEVVQQYCEGDAQGARLVSSGHQEFWSLIDPTEEGGAPGWDAVMLVAGFTVGNPYVRGNTAVVPVTFRRLGSFSDRFEAHSATETINFALIHRADGWKIRHSDVPPHVSVRTLQDHFLKMRWWFNMPEEKQRVRKMLYQVFRAILFDKGQSAGVYPGGVNEGH